MAVIPILISEKNGIMMTPLVSTTVDPVGIISVCRMQRSFLTEGIDDLRDFY